MDILTIILRHMTPLTTAALSFVLGFFVWVLWAVWPISIQLILLVMFLIILAMALYLVIRLIIDIAEEWKTKKKEEDE